MSTETQRHLARAKVVMAMFEHDGWRNLTDILRNTRADLANEIIYAKTWEDVCFLKGQISELDRVLNLEDYIGNTIDQVEAENADTTQVRLGE